MVILLKDLYFIASKLYYRVVLYLFFLLTIRNYSITDSLSSSLTLNTSKIIFIDANPTFELSYIVFLFIFLGINLPSALFMIDEPVLNQLFVSPQKNYNFLWSRIVASTIIMVPFILLSLLTFSCLNLSTFIIITVIGMNFIVFSGISTFLQNNILRTLLNFLVTIALMCLTFIKNPLLDYINSEISLSLVTNQLNTTLLSSALVSLFLLGAMITFIYNHDIRRRKING